MPAQKRPYTLFPLQRTGGYTRFMTDPAKDFKLLSAPEICVNSFGLLAVHARILLSVEQERRAIHKTGIVEGVMLECVEAVLHSTPEDNKTGTRKSRQLHRREAVLY